MADETKTEENKTQMETTMTSLKDASNVNEIEETIQKLSETTLEPYPQKLPTSTTSATATTTTTTNDSTTQQPKMVTPQQQQQPITSTSDNKEREREDIDPTNLIINYLPPTMSEGTLATLFSPYGLLERCKIVVDLQTLRSRGYGFVKYDNAISAERAKNALNGYELNGKKLKVAFARSQCKAITNSNLYLTNIPPHFTNSNLVKLFAEFGKIIECRVLMDQQGQSRGVGFVRMDTHHNAIQALQSMDRKVIEKNHPPIEVKLAQRRVPRRFWQENGGQNQGQGGRNQQGRNQGGNKTQGGNKQMGGGRNKKQNSYGSPNRKYGYSGQPRQNQMGGGAPMNNMGGPQQPRSRGGGQGGYYRPRYNNKGGYGQQQQRGRGGGGSPYFPQAPMYGDAPYAPMGYAQPGPPAQFAPMPQAMQAPSSNVMSSGNAPPVSSNQGPKRNKPIGNWE